MMLARYFAILVCLFSFSCTNKSVEPIDPFSQTTSASILISYDLDLTNVNAKACQLFFHNSEEKLHFIVEIPPGQKKLVRIPVSSGNFEFDRIQCYGTVTRPKSIMKFQVAPGSVAYLGYWQFSMDANTVYYGTSARKMVKKDLIAIASKQKMISALNGKAITEKMLVDTDEQYAVQMNSSIKVPLNNEIKWNDCYQAEVNENNVNIGRLKVRGTYNSQMLQSYEVVSDVNTYSAAFKLCVQDKLKTFRPAVKNKFTLDVTL